MYVHIKHIKLSEGYARMVSINSPIPYYNSIINAISYYLYDISEN